ncbi:hypothetical protein [Rhodopirellula sp. P2]|uniref:hypothetical protein n=1 Tax=Rhodopirellula sp. P2 TaxID=2127060 RepID=UPI002368AF95|nr:hypothetical protein [Rhodopirellula sp. P2]WDQ14823.1 hypothetical protein PSR62_14360 [Rhodopirellula sp. P2]
MQHSSGKELPEQARSTAEAAPERLDPAYLRNRSPINVNPHVETNFRSAFFSSEGSRFDL